MEQEQPVVNKKKCSNFWCNCQVVGKGKYCDDSCRETAQKYKNFWGKDPATGLPLGENSEQK